MCFSCFQTKTYEPGSEKTSLSDEVVNLVNYTHLIYEVLRSYPAIFMKLSPLFMEMWSLETIHCLNFNVQRRKCHDVTNDVKVNFLICGLVRCIKSMLVLSNILFYYP